MADPVDSEAVRAGAARYTRGVLFSYDVLVLAVVCRLVWRCPRSKLLRMYDRNVGKRHLDLGPGTGYFLRKCRYPKPDPALTLVDLNATVLATASGRLSRYRPTTYRRDVLRPLGLNGETYDSIGMNFLLHCLPGGMAGKAVTFDHAREHLAPGGRIFGATVLSEGVAHNWAARCLLRMVNANKTFDNRRDSLRGLRQEIASRFSDFELTVVGSVAIFEIRSSR